jgi:Ca2+-binding RTX toxin-like protein
MSKKSRTGKNSSKKTKSSSTLTDEQKQTFDTLLSDVNSSFEDSSSNASASQLKTDVESALSDQTVSRSELQTIVKDVFTVLESDEINDEAARNIFDDLQEVVAVSTSSRANDDLSGTDGDDILSGGTGNDRLTGTVSSNAGTDEIDLLIGGSGKDTFVLGNASQIFYDDGKTDTEGSTDYAVILDFNQKKDTIQLKGSSSNYSLGTLPNDLNITGTGIYYKISGSESELVGVIVGVTLSDLNTGFTFV